MLRYTLMRLGIFLGCLVVVWGLVYSGIFPSGRNGSNGWWVLLLALVISAPISFVVLRKERDRASMKVAERVDRMKANMRASAGVEDAADEQARSEAEAARSEASKAS
ncbi:MULTISPECIES: DUF4229 domain-containing protein [Streptomyces]|uniref:DUF4229 domain-containing protein n=1 Tax=Streptomyces thermoviolaceus subsp. thermoviolaceus TaxID=66860 RepID=A0ABX0YV58_STRTL|nr:MULTISPECIES: DUF4229 domain-containing protein [Streptomyces]MCM3263543.1 DUF4229 domain-containing protein [Streptomyces thermoviolaceus]NJP14971.1 DUF4229 domain-containing protein [Streptomyces thermoviolaceus subsp. thermoviolaceus]RSS07187.1 DUF4229 domain-containing protein [Streptomyces sp. WAC00469]WTD48027.1 DUF4229 domain-containing protein [Streptomyces thermoviolaceus]GGV78001.1 membrane protein [Streptomyces thermoviolaceus subsp. apingens]